MKRCNEGLNGCYKCQLLDLWNSITIKKGTEDWVESVPQPLNVLIWRVCITWLVFEDTCDCNITHMCGHRSIKLNRTVEKWVHIKVVVMINRSQKLISYEFLLIIGHDWITQGHSLTLYVVLIKNSFYYPLRPLFDRRPVERNKAVENGSKRSIKAVFGQLRIKPFFSNVQLCSIIN